MIIIALVYLFFIFINIKISFENYSLWLIYHESFRLHDCILFGIIAFILILAPIICGIIKYITNDKIRENNEWLKREFYKYNITTNNIKDKLQGMENGDYLIITKDKRLFIFNNYYKKSREIDLKSILKIDVNAKINEKNAMKVISLTPTFNRYTTVIGLEFKVITETETHIINCIDKGFHPDKTPAKLYSIQKDNLERFKLLLEKEIKSLNTIN